MVQIDIGSKKKVANNKAKIWTDHHYVIIDEVSMMDCKMIVDLHNNLGAATSLPGAYFGGVNVIFMGDFLQLPSVSQNDVYVNKPCKYEHGHHQWRSLNAVVIFTEQMRQSDDPEFAAALRQIRLRVPTPADIDLLNSRVGACLQCPTSIPIIVRRHPLREAINADILQEMSRYSNIPITHCLADITNCEKMSLSDAYSVKGGRSTIKADGILSVIPGAPLMITRNINIPLGIFDCHSKLNYNRACKWCHRGILWFRR